MLQEERFSNIIELLTRREQEIPHFYKDATEKVVVKSYI